MMKSYILIIVLVVGLMFSLACKAQPGKDRLKIPQEYVDNSQKVYDGFEFMFAQLSEYVSSNEYFTQDDIDSVRKTVVADYINHSELNPLARETFITEDTSPEAATYQPLVQKLIDEATLVIKAYNPKIGMVKLADQLGLINLKAAETLSETDASIIYSVTSTTYFSTIYWTKNFQKWQKLNESIAEKIRK